MRNLGFRVLIIFALVALLVPQAGQAVVTFTQLEDDVFVVSHRVKFIGSRGQAMKLVYEKAASLCVAAGYSHLEILQQESEAAQHDDSANASVRARFFFSDGEGRIDCEKNARQEYLEQAHAKLAKRGYQPPERPEPSGQDRPAEGGQGGLLRPADQGGLSELRSRRQGAGAAERGGGARARRRCLAIAASRIAPPPTNTALPVPIIASESPRATIRPPTGPALSARLAIPATTTPPDRITAAIPPAGTPPTAANAGIQRAGSALPLANTGIHGAGSVSSRA